MFKDLNDMLNGNRGVSRRWITLPVSLLLHATLVGAIVVAPLLVDPGQPEVQVIMTQLMTPTTPTVPPGRPAGVRRPVEQQRPREQQRVVHNPHILVAPATIPQEIKPTTIDDLFPDGDPHGIEGIPEEVVGVPFGLGDPLSSDGENTSAQPPLRPVQKPRLIKRVEPNYPPIALSARIQGTVVIEAETDIYGRVRTTRVISGQPLLNDAALQAVRLWIYEPYLIGGVPRGVVFTVTVTFGLSNQ